MARRASCLEQCLCLHSARAAGPVPCPHIAGVASRHVRRKAIPMESTCSTPHGHATQSCLRCTALHAARSDDRRTSPAPSCSAACPSCPCLFYKHTHANGTLAVMMDINYYPKLQGCVPFSPVPGPRLLTLKDQSDAQGKAATQKALATALIQLMGMLQASHECIASVSCGA
eukprot:1157762-Pelagomonas_calceolata.AAC.6